MELYRLNTKFSCQKYQKPNWYWYNFGIPKSWYPVDTTIVYDVTYQWVDPTWNEAGLNKESWGLKSGLNEESAMPNFSSLYLLRVLSRHGKPVRGATPPPPLRPGGVIVVTNFGGAKRWHELLNSHWSCTQVLKCHGYLSWYNLVMQVSSTRLGAASANFCPAGLLLCLTLRRSQQGWACADGISRQVQCLGRYSKDICRTQHGNLLK